MADYPSFYQAPGTTRKMESGVMVRKATNLKNRNRALASAAKYHPTVVHIALSQAQMDALKAFEATVRGDGFNFVYRPTGETLWCTFDADPFDETPVPRGGGVYLYNVTVKLIQSD